MGELSWGPTWKPRESPSWGLGSYNCAVKKLCRQFLQQWLLWSTVLYTRPKRDSQARPQNPHTLQQVPIYKINVILSCSLKKNGSLLWESCHFKGNLQRQHRLQFHEKRVCLPFVFIQNNTSKNILCNNIEGFYYFIWINLWEFFYRWKTSKKTKVYFFWKTGFLLSALYQLLCTRDCFEISSLLHYVTWQIQPTILWKSLTLLRVVPSTVLPEELFS